MPTIRGMMANAGIAVGGLDAIGVVHGPGSFTGVRVGLSAAKGLSEACGVPVVAISRLALLAEVADAEHVFLDAGRGEFYCGHREVGGIFVEELLGNEGGKEAARLGSAVTCEAKVVEGLAGLSVRLVGEPGAAAMMPMVARRIREGRFDDAATIDANYLRRTDAELFAKQAVRWAP